MGFLSSNIVRTYVHSYLPYADLPTKLRPCFDVFCWVCYESVVLRLTGVFEILESPTHASTAPAVVPAILEHVSDVGNVIFSRLGNSQGMQWFFLLKGHGGKKDSANLRRAQPLGSGPQVRPTHRRGTVNADHHHTITNAMISCSNQNSTSSSLDVSHG